MLFSTDKHDKMSSLTCQRNFLYCNKMAIESCSQKHGLEVEESGNVECCVQWSAE